MSRKGWLDRPFYARRDADSNVRWEFYAGFWFVAVLLTAFTWLTFLVLVGCTREVF